MGVYEENPGQNDIVRLLLIDYNLERPEGTKNERHWDDDGLLVVKFCNTRNNMNIKVKYDREAPP